MTVPPAEVSMAIRAMSPGGTVYFPRYDPVTGTFEVTGLFPGIYQISGSSRDPVLTGGCVSRNVLVTNVDVTGLELIVKQCN